MQTISAINYYQIIHNITQNSLRLRTEMVPDLTAAIICETLVKCHGSPRYYITMIGRFSNKCAHGACCTLIIVCMMISISVSSVFVGYLFVMRIITFSAGYYPMVSVVIPLHDPTRRDVHIDIILVPSVPAFFPRG